MIRFRRITGFAAPYDRRRLPQIERLFARAFKAEGYPFSTIETMIENSEQLDFEPILLVAENMRRQITGLSFSFYFQDLRLAYLQYIASDPARSRRGVGGAIYEALRELLVARGARGLFLDIAPIEREQVGDRKALSLNRRRLRFYEQYGARAVEGSNWDRPNPRNNRESTALLFDPLGRERPLPRAEARKAVRRILRAQYGFDDDSSYLAGVVRSFKHDPVRLRAPQRPTPLPPAPKGVTLTRLHVVVAERHDIHHLREKGYVERPARVNAILRGLEGLPIERVAMQAFDDDNVTAVHDERLVGFLKAAQDRLPPDTVVYAETFPPRNKDRLPSTLPEQAGYFSFDTYSPVTRNSYAAARAAVDCALTGARRVLDGASLAYALCRPPGHHAERSAFGGFCYLNNAAIAAHYLSRRGRVALLDVDYHHGNGAEEIFYRRRDVLTVSLHGDPSFEYPNFAGFADETGQAAGLGFNLNLPLPRGTEDAAYLAALDSALERVTTYGPEFLIVSLGFDTMRGDPTGSFLVTSHGMLGIGERIGRLGLPTLVVQEGGYSLRNLRLGAHSFFSGLARSWI